MKKIDKLIITAFLGPFFLTFLVVVFILLTQYMLRYIEDIVGKDLGFAVISELLFYFSLNMVPTALPLGILLSSLMTFGNLGEHFELTAIKSAGISLTRTLIPIFFLVIIFCGIAFYFNNTVLPWANLKAFSLLYDVRQKKPSLDFKEGAFYNGLPGYSVKISKKFPDGKSIKGVMIYNHTSGRGNTDVILADSGAMYTIHNDTYLVLELFNGSNYSENVEGTSGKGSSKAFIRNNFYKSKMVFSLESFQFSRTQEELFATNKLMLDITQLNKTTDSLRRETEAVKENLIHNIQPFYTYHSLRDTITSEEHLSPLPSDDLTAGDAPDSRYVLNRAVNQARSIKAYTASHLDRTRYYEKEANMFEIEKYRKFTQSIACIIMFLIGAPLGAIIKKGGIGVPAIVSIFFFIFYYVLSMMGEKWAKEGVVEVMAGMWGANMILLPLGLFFLRQARNDAMLFERDFYAGWWKKVKRVLKF